LIAIVKAQRTTHAKVSQQVQVFNTPELQSNQKGTCQVNVPSIWSSGTTTAK